MKTSSASILFALAASLAVNCIPVPPDHQNLSSSFEVIDAKAQEAITGDSKIALRMPSSRRRRDDITTVKTRITTEDKGAPKRTLALPNTNTIANNVAPYYGQTIKGRTAEAKKIPEPNCFASESGGAGCVINLRE